METQDHNEIQKLHWLRLDSRFFDKHEIQLLMRENHEYLLIYIRLLVESIPYQGRLRYKTNIPYTMIELARLCEVELEVFEGCMDDLIRHELAIIEKDNTIFLPAVEKMTSSSTKWAQYKRRQRNVQVETDYEVVDGFDPDDTPPTPPTPRSPNRPVKKQQSATSGLINETRKTYSPPSATNTASPKTTGVIAPWPTKTSTRKSVNAPANDYPETYQELRKYLIEEAKVFYTDDETLATKFIEMKEHGWVDAKKKPINNWRQYFTTLANKLVVRQNLAVNE